MTAPIAESYNMTPWYRELNRYHWFVLIVAALGSIFESDDQKFFLLQIWNNPDYLRTFLKNGLYLAFIPVFFEGAFWIMELSREETLARRESKDTSA